MGLKEVMDINKDTSCLKIMYYINEFNQSVKAEEICDVLELSETEVKRCKTLMIREWLIIMHNDNRYSLTQYCKMAFKTLLESETYE